MMRELYQEMILDHNKSPRNKGVLDHVTHDAEGHNPLCGDQVHVYLDVVDGRIAGISFEGHGCAISTASASMMTEALKGRPVEDAERVFGVFHQFVTTDATPMLSEDLEVLEVLGGVREFPMRVKCATLPWHTFAAALKQESGVSTE